MPDHNNSQFPEGVAMLPVALSTSRDLWRNDRRKLSAKELIRVVAKMLLNNIDMATRPNRDQESTSAMVAVDISTELNYEDLKKIRTVHQYLSATLALANIALLKDVKESNDGPYTIVKICLIAHHCQSDKKLAQADMTQVRRLLKHFRESAEAAAA